MKYLNSLNEAQKESVQHVNGPALIIAAAGSGKTRVLTYRIAYLLHRGICPSNILALTFTNKAAQNMKDRIAGIVGDELTKFLWMGTFHSIFGKILRYEAQSTEFTANYTIYDTQDSRNLLKGIIKGMQLDDKKYTPNLINKIISTAKNKRITPQQYMQDKDFTRIDIYKNRPFVGEIYQRYVNRCKKSDAMDFDDLLVQTALLFDKHKKILEKYQQRFLYILVDEFQDTNYVQNYIIKKLSAVHRNICVVGDDAQSIYSFRGAEIQNILNFRKDYPDYRLFKLEQNYRSTQNIVNAANGVILKNQNQIRKVAFSKNEPGEKIKIIKTMTDVEEGFLVVQELYEEHLQEQQSFDKFAILYRTNAQSRIFEEALRKRNIPYRIYGGLSFYQRKEIKDILAYFRLTVNPNDEEAFKRIINYPRRGIGTTTIGKIISAAGEKGKGVWDVILYSEKYSLKINQGTQNKLNKFATLIKGFQQFSKERNVYESAVHIIQASGVITHLKNDTTPEGISRVENMTELLNGIQEFNETALEEGVENNLSSYLAVVSLHTTLDEKDKTEGEKVNLMTIHAAKGLEYNHVFIVGVEDNLLPAQYGGQISEKELEEERRLFYVAITRAQKKVTLSYSGMRYKWGSPNFSSPSRFIREIDPKYIENPFEKEQSPVMSFENKNKKTLPRYQKLPKLNSGNTRSEKITGDDPEKIHSGMIVVHDRFGKGKVLSTEGTMSEKKVTVFFQNRGQKKLLLKYAKLKIIS